MSNFSSASCRFLANNVISAAVFLQATIYLIAAPAAVATLQGSWGRYIWILAVFLAFFFVPFAAIVSVSFRRTSQLICKVEVDNYRLALLATFLLSFEAIYWYTIFSVDLLTRRIGTEIAAEVFASLTLLQLAVIRLHDSVVITLPALLLVLCMRAGRLRQRAVGWVLFTVALASFSAHTLLNSRLQFVLGLVLVFAILMQMVTLRCRSFSIFRAVVVVCAVTYALTLISNLRNVVATDGDLTLAVLVPLSLGDDPAFHGASDLVAQEWVQRLDCVDLIDRISPSIEDNGFEWGRAWAIPTFMLYGALTDPTAYLDLKSDAMTTAKAVLIKRHTDLDLRDYYSCALTDAYANFWIFGLLMAAVYFGLAAALVQRALASSSPAVLVLGVFAFIHVSAFEAEFITHLIGWVRVVPIAIALILLNPVMSVSRTGASVTTGRLGTCK